jgi:hypothetical protein
MFLEAVHPIYVWEEEELGNGKRAHFSRLIIVGSKHVISRGSW